MEKYKCSICGFVYDEEEQGTTFADLKECPVCKHPAGFSSLVRLIKIKESFV